MRLQDATPLQTLRADCAYPLNVQRSAARADPTLFETSSRFSNFSNVAHRNNASSYFNVGSNYSSKFNLAPRADFANIFEPEASLSNPQFLSALKQPLHDSEGVDEDDEYLRYM